MKILNPNINLSDYIQTQGKGALIMLDYDGTLAPFVVDRMKAFPYPGISELLKSLVQQSRLRVVIISGRSLDDLKKLIGHRDDLELWGSHGLERQLPNGKAYKINLDTGLRHYVDKGIESCLKFAGKKHCEIKPYGVAFHWRGIGTEEKNQRLLPIEKDWKKICSESELEMHSFDHGIELRPKKCNKGDVVNTLLSETPSGTALAYFGDDLTDEDAFAALGNKGLKVLVRAELRPTLADIYLIPPLELMSFLGKWKE